MKCLYAILLTLAVGATAKEPTLVSVKAFHGITVGMSETMAFDYVQCHEYEPKDGALKGLYIFMGFPAHPENGMVQPTEKWALEYCTGVGPTYRQEGAWVYFLDRHISSIEAYRPGKE